jgi:four helix bundle protein
MAQSQARRSVVSNIAEGGRLTAEFRQLGIGRGSNFELQTQLEIARSLEMGDPKLLDEADGLSARGWENALWHVGVD